MTKQELLSGKTVSFSNEKGETAEVDHVSVPGRPFESGFRIKFNQGLIFANRSFDALLNRINSLSRAHNLREEVLA